MKKITLSLLFVFVSLFVCAQNYQCLQSRVVHFFANSNAYIRGIRIDSVHTIDSSVVYYPYHTERKSYYLGGIGTPADDINGSSWLGKNVVALPDGTFIFNNYWDTVFIKSQAGIGDSWLFYNDTTDLYYTATVTAMDTMTILGALDSVKIITISADSAGYPHPIDLLNNFQIILSKNNGFVQVFDLYTFPYRYPDPITFNMYEGIYQSRFYDFYLDALLNNLGTCDECFDIPADTSNSIFRLINFYNPTMMELYDFTAGDVYELSKSTTSGSGSTGEIWGGYVLDSFLSKIITPYSVSYTMMEHSESYYCEESAGSPPVYSDYVYAGGAGSVTYDTTLLINRMPEEFDGPGILHYYPNPTFDTTSCYSAASYRFDPGCSSQEYSYNDFADVPLANTQTYNIGYPGFSMYQEYPDFVTSVTQNLIYAYKNGEGCMGSFVSATPNAVQNILPAVSLVSFFPNPANETLNLQSASVDFYKITVYNILGQLVTALEFRQQQTITTASLPIGIYNILITGDDGYRQYEKISVIH